QQLARWPTVNHSIDALPEAYHRLRQNVAHDADQWPVQLASLTSRISDLSDVQQRAARIDRLRQIHCVIRLLNARIGPPFEADVVGGRLASAHRYDQLAWLARRDQTAMQSVPSPQR